jgi:DNA polymerase-3 subunit delta'
MQFKQIINQQQVKQQLIELVQHNRLSHALLFLGKEGSGALPLAIAFAQYLVCEKTGSGMRLAESGVATPSLFGDETTDPQHQTNDNRLSTTDSCGACPGCIKAQQLIHPDIHFSYPTVTKKAGEKPIATDFFTAWREFIRENPYGNLYDWIEYIKEKENSQGKITAEECNDILRKLSLKSFESVYKILIMWMPELLGNEGNKLLKLIEEPPANTLIILVAENESLVLPTIVSRCQLIKIPALGTKDIEETLIQKNNIEPARARQVAAISDGNYRDALQLVQNADDDLDKLLRDWLNAILKNGPLAQTKWVEEISRLGREKQKQFLRYFNHLLEKAVRFRVAGTGQTETVRPGSEQDFADRLNKLTGIEQQRAIIEELDRATYHIERNANAKILFHALTIRLYHVIQNKIVFLED